MRWKKRKRNNIMIFGLCAILICMGVGYAAFSSKLDIKGVSSITSTWDIRITDVQTKELIGSAENAKEPTFDDLSANMEANFYNPGDAAIYEVTVSNLGTLDAVLDSIKINGPKQDIIVFSIEGISAKEDLLQGESKTFEVIVKYNETVTSQPETTSFSFNVDLEYLQKGNSTNFSEADSDEVESGFRISNLEVNPSETSLDINMTADTAIKYYYSLDNDKWYESTENTYTLYNLKPNTEYTVYVKAENAEGEVVFASTITRTTDVTKPKIELSIGDNVEGENDWYKGLDINVEVSDNDAVASTKYCTTTSETCSPNKELEITNNKGTIQLESNSNNQKVCVQATDQVGNETTECSDSYKVDGNIPEITNMTLLPDDDTMTIELDVTENESGIEKYYFSKDSGNSYIESDNPNYTFTSLEEGDYLVTAYVKDKAGNISEIEAKSTTIRHAAFCEHNDITDLGDCIIATEAGNETDIELAKSEIESKGTPNFNTTSPSIVYNELHGTTTSTTSHTYYDNIGTNYSFNATTGIYTLRDYSYVDPSSIDYSSGDYYTCISTATSCSTLYKITGVTTSTNSSTGQITYTITKYNYTQTPASYDTSGVGMYAGEDNDGTTYYYRGSVGGNYVKFNDMYWRIIRVNGDGSVRMIYDGTSPHANGEESSNRQVTTKAFNSYINDNAYVGYMYGDPNDFVETDSGSATFNYTGLSSSAKYYFATDYTLDESTRSFKLAGDFKQGTLGTDKVGYYTCFSTSQTASCQRLFYTTKYNTSTSMTVKAKGYGSTSLEGAHANVTDSTMKTYLDSWYSSNMTEVDDKISKDAVFCNNRNKSSKNGGTYTNTGYGITPTIYGYERFWNWASQGKLDPTLMCETNDSFSVNKGNQKLTYPVGLITADEVNMAGGMTSMVNSLYYLYTGTTYWTMSPSYFPVWFNAVEMDVDSSGALYNDDAWGSYGVRPVINLNTDNLTVTGSGTMEDPFVVS